MAPTYASIEKQLSTQIQIHSLLTDNFDTQHREIQELLHIERPGF